MVFLIRIKQPRTRRQLVRALFVETRPSGLGSWFKAVKLVIAGETVRYEKVRTK